MDGMVDMNRTAFAPFTMKADLLSARDPLLDAGKPVSAGRDKATAGDRRHDSDHANLDLTAICKCRIRWTAKRRRCLMKYFLIASVV
jgi:hypothetical protein